MVGRRKTTEERDKKICKEYKKGKSKEQLATLFNLSKNAINMIILKNKKNFSTKRNFILDDYKDHYFFNYNK